MAVSAGILSFIDEVPELVCLHFPSLFEYVMNSLNSEHHMVVEIGLAVMFDLVGRNSDRLATLWPEIIEKFDAIFAFGHEPAVRSALGVFGELLYVTEIEDRLVARVLMMLFRCLQNYGSMADMVLTAIVALCKSAGEGVRPFISQLVNLIEKVWSMSNPILKCKAVEALGFVLRNCQEECAEISLVAAQMYVECIQSDDIQLITSGFTGLKEWLSAASDSIRLDWSAVLEGCFAVLKWTPEQVPWESCWPTKLCALDLLRVTGKFHGFVVESFSTQILDLVQNCLDLDDFHIRIMAAKTFVELIRRSGEVPDLFLQRLSELCEDSNHDTAIVPFCAYSRLLKYELLRSDASQKYVSGLIQTSFQALACELACQTTMESLDFEISEAVFGFLATVAQYMPTMLPLDQILKMAGKASGYEILNYVMVLTECYSVAHSTIPSLLRKSIEHIFENTLKLCDVNHPPHPISAMRCLMETNNHVTEPQFTNIVEFASHILQTEFMHQAYFWSVMAAVVSLLLSLSRISGRTLGDLLPRIISIVPECLCESDADNILKSLVSLVIEHESREEFAKMAVKVLGMRESKLKKLKVTPEAISGVAEMLARISAQHLIEGVEPIEMDRIQRRMACYVGMV
jgi:hypothetical protein